MTELNYATQLLKNAQNGNGLKPHAHSMEELKEEDFSNFDVVKLALIADRMQNIGKFLYDQTKEQAAEQLQLTFEDNKNEVHGNQVTVQTRESYSYPDDDPLLLDYSEHIDKLNTKIKSIKESQKPYKQGIKSRQQQLELEGKAKLESVTKYISISRK